MLTNCQVSKLYTSYDIVTVGCYGVIITFLNAHIIVNVVCAPIIVRHTKTHNEKKDMEREGC